MNINKFVNKKTLYSIVIAVVVLAAYQYFTEGSVDIKSAVVSSIEQNTDIKLQRNLDKMQLKEQTEFKKSEHTLDLSAQKLSSLPSYVLSESDLESLDISYNAISGALPAEIRHLSNLKRLNMSHNKMTGVPAEIGQLSNLEYLDLSHNSLTGLPHELGNLTNLKELNISGNNYSQFDLETISEKLPETTQIIK